MGTIEIVVDSTNRSRPPSAYRIADQRIVTDAGLVELGPYRTEDEALWSDKARAGTAAACGKARLIFAGTGRIANGLREVECRRMRERYELRLPGLASFGIMADGTLIHRMAIEGPVEERLLGEIAVGAPLMLAFALQGIFCLHISVIEVRGLLIGFMGESGQGKSTMAAVLGHESGPNWRRIIDDTLPVTLDESGQIAALPHFPQLKLEEEAQPVGRIGERTALDALYLLESERTVHNDEVVIDPLTGSAAMLAAMQHTVGARLFDSSLLRHHMAFCAALAAEVPMRLLSYPRRLSSLNVVRKSLLGDLLEMA